MNDQLEDLQALNSLLADYAESLTAAAGHAPLTPEAREALRQVYDLQSKVARRIHGLLGAGAEVTVAAAPKPKPLRKPNPAVSGFKEIVLQTKQRRHESLDKIIRDPNFGRRFDRFNTILGPNEFPDDRHSTRMVFGPPEFPDDPKPTPKGRPG
ncbi:MAG: hypothetical protein CFE45_27375 [Burkholderiales bacterium PBB5]|nr:MAG: hypothetical protein CFE45_27375 [Burkholderiales bacterium PBB5]